MAEICRRYLKDHSNAVVVNLGCGLDTTFSQVDSVTAVGYQLDFPDVIAAREELLVTKERQSGIARDLNNHDRFDSIEFTEEDDAVFFASGVFYYLKNQGFLSLFRAMAKRFPGAKLVFDASNAKGLKNMLKTWLKPSEMENVGLYFSVDDEQQLAAWSQSFSSVTRRGYMTGYRELDKRYGLIANTIFKFGDRSNMCQIIEIEFKR